MNQQKLSKFRSIQSNLERKEEEKQNLASFKKAF